MQRRIEIDGVTYICNVTHVNEEEYWRCANVEKVAEHLRKNGAEVVEVTDRILVDREVYYFRGDKYYLDQCEDLLEWFKDSIIQDFTYYYDKVVFHTEDGFVAAYRDDINNVIRI